RRELRHEPLGVFDVRRVAALLEADLAVAAAGRRVPLQHFPRLADHRLRRVDVLARPAGEQAQLAEAPGLRQRRGRDEPAVRAVGGPPVGCGGETTSPGQPGSRPSVPRYPAADSDVSETIWSSAPYTHSTGGFGEAFTNRSTESPTYFGERAFIGPWTPGARPGQFGEGTESPG